MPAETVIDYDFLTFVTQEKRSNNANKRITTTLDLKKGHGWLELSVNYRASTNYIIYGQLVTPYKLISFEINPFLIKQR